MNDAVTLTTLSSIISLRSDVPSDNSGTDKHLFNIDQRGRIDTFSQELRAAIDLDPVKLTIGGNYQNDRTDDLYGVYYIANNNQIGPFGYNAFRQDALQRVDTYAVFASGEVPITSTLAAQAGVRCTKQNRNFRGCLRDGGDGRLAAAIAAIPTLAGLPFDPAPPGGCVTLDATFNRVPVVSDQLDEDNISWRAGLNWKPATATLIYANITRGYKAGAFTPVPAVFAGQFAPVKQEKVTSYEAGVKVALLDRKVDIAAAVFYSDYLNKQLLGAAFFPPFGALPTLQNTPKANVRGAEASINARPFAGLSLSGGVNLRCHRN